MAQQIKKKFIKSDAIDGSKIKLLNGQTLRMENAQGTEFDLLSVDSSGKLLSSGKEVAFVESVESQIESVRASLQDNIDSEESARIAGDQTLQDNIDSEMSRAMAAEGGLSSRLDVLEQDPVTKTYVDGEVTDLQTQINNVLSNIDPVALDSLTEIVSAFQSADNDLQGAINTLAQNSSENIEAEESARIAADQSLQSQLTQEVSDRQAADLVLQGNIDTEESERVAADLVLQGNIDSEMSRAMGVESSLQSQITQEVSDRQAADASLDSRLDILEAFGHEQIIHVSKNGSDSNTGKQHSPFLTITAAMNAILDASPSKRYAIKVAPGNYTETTLALKANVFIVGEGNKESVRITGPVSLGISFTANSSFDNRSGFHRVTLLSAANFDWNAVQSAAGKLYISETVFGSTLTMNGYNNAIAQAQFNECIIFGNVTISGINVGVFTDNVCFGNITLNQHPNGGMATILTATGGYCSGTVRQTTTVSDFNRRCASFLRGFPSENLIVDGPSSYADVDLTSQGKSSTQKLNNGQLIALNPRISHDLETQMIKPLSNNTHNMGDWGKQWMFNFGYVHASSGTDLYVISVDSSYDAAGSSAGYSVNIEADGYGLKPDVNGGNVKLATAMPSGSGVRGKIQLDGKEIDVTNKQVKNLADGVSSSDAVNKGQLDLVSSTLSSSIAQEVSDRQAAVSAEQSARIAGDEALQNSIDSEMSRAMGVEGILQDQITAETANRIAEIAQETSDRQAADLVLAADILDEKTRAMSAEDALDAKIDQEIFDRSEAVTNLQTQINNVLSNIDPEALDSLTEIVSAFQGADGSLQGAINTLAQNSSAAISEEESSRVAADLVLQGNIDTEESERIAADLVLQGNIDSEMSRAMSVESDLQNQITQEVSDRQAADLVLQGNIDTESFQRIAGDETLQSNIDAEMSRAMSVEGSLQSQITQEVSDRQADVDEEMSRAMGVESSLQSQISQEVSDRTAADLVLQGNIDSEQSARTAADLSLQGEIDALELRVDETESDISTLQSQVLNLDSDITSIEGDISNLESSLSSEISRAIAAENALDARLDVLEAKTFGKETFSITTNLTHVDMSREVIANSLVVFVGRLAAHKDLDFTVSVVGGVTRLTWIGSFAQMGEEAVAEGDVVFVTYAY